MATVLERMQRNEIYIFAGGTIVLALAAFFFDLF